MLFYRGFASPEVNPFLFYVNLMCNISIGEEL